MPFKLQRVETPVYSVTGQKILMASQLDQFAVFNDHYLVCAPNGRKSVRDDEHRSALRYSFESLTNELFGF